MNASGLSELVVLTSSDRPPLATVATTASGNRKDWRQVRFQRLHAFLHPGDSVSPVSPETYTPDRLGRVAEWLQGLRSVGVSVVATIREHEHRQRWRC